jgi:2-keto-3-deoxy-L-rhamnonate aldolase RhmA
MAAGFRDPEVVELIGVAGYDAVLIDMEHSAFSFETVADMICRADLAGISSLVRVPSNDPKAILRLLDVGADGIFVPHIRGVEDAREAVRAVRYPPLGSRGAVSTARAARFGTVRWPEHVAASNREIVLAVMVEDADVVDHVEAIAALDGLDLVFVGPFDLAMSMGALEPNDPRVRTAVRSIAERVRSVGRAKFGFPLNHAAMPMDVPELIEIGASFAWCVPGPQVMLLNTFRSQVSAARAKMDGLKEPAREAATTRSR